MNVHVYSKIYVRITKMSKSNAFLDPVFRLIDLKKLGTEINGTVPDVRKRLTENVEFMTKIAPLCEQASKLKHWADTYAAEAIKGVHVESEKIPYTSSELSTMSKHINKLIIEMFRNDRTDIIAECAKTIRHYIEIGKKLNESYVKRCCLRFREDTKDDVLLAAALADIVMFYFHGNLRNKVSDKESKARLRTAERIITEVVASPQVWIVNVCKRLCGEPHKLDFSKYTIEIVKVHKGYEIFFK